MTTATFIAPFAHTTSQNFNDWVSNFTFGLEQCGLVQTADTGQTGFGSPLITIPAANNHVGYQIWRFNDSLQGSFPVFIRFNFGTGNATGRPGVEMIVGTGSNGSGTITNPALTIDLDFALTASNFGVHKPWYFVHTEGFFACLVGVGNMQATAPNVPTLAAVISRSCDASGMVDGNGLFVTAVAQNNSFTNVSSEISPPPQFYNYGTNTWAGTVSTVLGAQCSWMMLPNASTVNSTLVDGVVSVFPAFGGNPHFFPLPTLVSLWTTDIPEYVTFTATPIGTTERTYLVLPWNAFGAPPYQINESFLSNNTAGMAIVWE